MKKTVLEPWGPFEKLCLISTVYKLKSTIGDQNWGAISKHTKLLYDSIGSLIEYEKRNDEWFSIKQCCAQYQSLIKGTGTRKKKRGERNTDNTESLELLETSLKQEFLDELRASLDQMKKDYTRSKQIVDDIDNNRLDEERLDELLMECEEKSINIKTKLKTMLDEKNAEIESIAKPPQPTPSVSSEPPSSTSEAKPCSTTSPLLTSLLQSPSPLIRTSLPSASSPTISLLLHSSPPVPITDSTLSKLLETPSNIQTSPTTSTVLAIPSSSSSQQSPHGFKSANEDKPLVIEKVDSEKIEEGRIILEELTDVEHDVVESEIIIEQQESPPSKKSIPRRIDLEVEDVETDEEVLETVEEMIERVEEAIIETDGENNLTEIHLPQSEEPSITIDTDIDQLEIGQEQTVEVIVLGSTQDIDDGSNLLNNETVIISGPPVKINQDTVVINEGDESPVKISDAVVITEPPVKISESTIVLTDESLKLDESGVLNSLLGTELNKDTAILSDASVHMKNDSVVLTEPGDVMSSETVILTGSDVKDAVILAEAPVEIHEETVVIAGDSVHNNNDTVIIDEDPITIIEKSVEPEKSPVKITEETFVISNDSINTSDSNIQISETSDEHLVDTVDTNSSPYKNSVPAIVVEGDRPIEYADSTIVIENDSPPVCTSPNIADDISESPERGRDPTVDVEATVIIDDNDTLEKSVDSAIVVHSTSSSSELIYVKDGQEQGTDPVTTDQSSLTTETVIVLDSPEKSPIDEHGNASEIAEQSSLTTETIIVLDSPEKSPIGEHGNAMVITDQSSEPLYFGGLSEKDNTTNQEDDSGQLPEDIIIIRDSPERSISERQRADNHTPEPSETIVIEDSNSPDKIIVVDDSPERDIREQQREDSLTPIITATFSIREDSPERSNDIPVPLPELSFNKNSIPVDLAKAIVRLEPISVATEDPREEDSSSDDSTSDSNTDGSESDGSDSDYNAFANFILEFEGEFPFDDPRTNDIWGYYFGTDEICGENLEETSDRILSRFACRYGMQLPEMKERLNKRNTKSLLKRLIRKVRNRRLKKLRKLNKEKDKNSTSKPNASEVSHISVDETLRPSTSKQAKDKETNPECDDFQSKEHVSRQQSDKILSHPSVESDKNDDNDDDEKDEDFHSVCSGPPVPDNEDSFVIAEEGKENIGETVTSTKEYVETQDTAQSSESKQNNNLSERNTKENAEAKGAIIEDKNDSENNVSAAENLPAETSDSKTKRSSVEKSFNEYESKDKPTPIPKDDDDDDDDEDKDSVSDSDDTNTSKDKSDSTTTTTATTEPDELDDSNSFKIDDKETLSEITEPESEETSTEGSPSTSLPALKEKEITFHSVVSRCYEDVKNKAAELLSSPKRKEKPSEPSEKVAEKPPRLGRKRPLSSIDSKPDSPSLSISSSDEDRDLRAWKKSIMLVYNRLASHKFASVFSKPITEHEAPGYHDIVLRPMDLSTIKKSIENGTVRTTVEFQRDMLLMVQNSIIYNKDNTPYFKMALEMGEDMLGEMEIMVQALGDGVPLLGDSGLPRARTTKSSIEDSSRKRKITSSDDGRLSKRKRTSSS